MTDSVTSRSEDVQLQSVRSVTWTDDDGTTYERVFDNGEIKDIEVN